MKQAKTMAEKILSSAAGREVVVGDIAVCTPYLAMGTDGSIPMAINYLEVMNADHDGPSDPSQIVFAFDHYGLKSGPSALRLQGEARSFAQRFGLRVYEAGEGIGHQIIMEEGLARPGTLLVGADSHATSYGAFGCFSTGIGSSDLAGIMLTRKLWLEVPASIRIELRGRLNRHVSAKDIALYLARMLRADGANYLAIEFTGPGVDWLSMEDRIVLSNMSVELGAKAGIFPYDGILQQHLNKLGVTHYTPIHADADASYTENMVIDLDKLTPQVAMPHRVDNVVDLDEVPYTEIDVVYLGTCTGGRLQDYEEALAVLEDAKHVSSSTQVIITPASRKINIELAARGILDKFRKLGAMIELPGCGACCGTCGSVSAGQTIISSANRNFKGRMGDTSAKIFLASPYSCAKAAVDGFIGRRQEA